MTLDKARELIAVQVDCGGGYNRNAARLILAEVAREHGQASVDAMILEFALEALWQIQPGTDFSGLNRY